MTEFSAVRVSPDPEEMGRAIGYRNVEGALARECDESTSRRLLRCVAFMGREHEHEEALRWRCISKRVGQKRAKSDNITRTHSIASTQNYVSLFLTGRGREYRVTPM